MLKHRQDGLVFLHGLALQAGIIALFLGLVATYRHHHWSGLPDGLSWTTYLLGIVLAMTWNLHALQAYAVRLCGLDVREVVRLTRQQLYRLMAALFAVGFLTQEQGGSRTFVLTFVLLAGFSLLVLNSALPRRLAAFLFRSSRMRTAVLAGAGEAGQLGEWLAEREYLGQVVVGYVPPPGAEQVSPPPLGELRDLRRTLRDEAINQVVVNRRQFTPAQMGFILAEAERAGCRVRYFVDLCEGHGGESMEVECQERYAFAAEAPEPLDNPVNGLLKRALDLAVALPVVCFVLPPLTFVVWAAQRLQSPGPVFYRQERSGLNRRHFHIFKYRTMHVCPALEARQATRGDARVYGFGGFLRKTSLDEVPQFLNVLLGEMSVSGPRPHLLEHDRQFASLVPAYYQRQFVKPGITGLAQSEGFRGEVAGRPELLRQRIAHDLRYVKRWSLVLDLRILAATARQVLRPPPTAY